MGERNENLAERLLMCAAWCDTFCWAERDENIRFDGTAFYDWALDEVLTDLRAALRDCDAVLDELVAATKVAA